MTTHFPVWLRKRIEPTSLTRGVLEELKLKTVCVSARCPNVQDCFSRHTAAFMILGNICTRRCAFCAVSQGSPMSPEEDEPGRLTEAIRRLRISHAVITSVTRDDLTDGGALQFSRTITTIREAFPSVTIEVLTPDFKGNEEAVETVIRAEPDIYNHNLETVARLQRTLRPGARYERSLGILHYVKKRAPHIVTKSGLMVGLGERGEEVGEALADLRRSQCDRVTIGQYLRPSARQVPVEDYIPPELFRKYEEKAYALGFAHVFSGPFVRSSYRADQAQMKITLKERMKSPHEYS
ncbi:MAG: lipoyl synthase [Candidatus Omnitrophota bacterium]